MNLDGLRAIISEASAAGGHFPHAQSATQHIVGYVLTAYRNIAENDESLSFYRNAHELLHTLCTEPETLQLFADPTSLTQRFLAKLKIPSDNAETIVQGRLLRRLWMAIWGRDLWRLREADFASIVQVQGLHNLPENWQRSGIIFIHWHAPLTQAFWTWLKSAGVQHGTIIGQERWKLQEHERNDHAKVTLQSALDLRLAIQAIAAGSHAHILPDAISGRRPSYHDFLGRRRPFQPGFAEVALRTRAPCHPVSVQLAENGDVLIRISPAFTHPSDNQTAQAGLLHLVEQYADHLAELWRASPAEIDPAQIRGFMLMPRANHAEPTSEPSPKLAFCVGMLSSGSTWVFNAVRQIWLDEAPPGQLKSLYTEQKTEIDTCDQLYLVVKTHLNGSDTWFGMETIMLVSNAPVIISVRDPLDAVASLMLRFDMSFEVALQQVVCSARSIMSLIGRRPDALILRYEDETIGQPETLDRIATHIGASPSTELRREILKNLSTECVQATIAQLAAEHVINDWRSWDPETQWHAGHIGDGRIGKYAEVLSEARQGFVAAQTAPFARRFGYVPPFTLPRLVLLTDFEFWRAGSFFATWVAQCLDVICRSLPISVICIGNQTSPGAQGTPGIKVMHLAPNAAEVASTLATHPIFGTAIACTKKSNAALFKQAAAAIPACANIPCLDFTAHDETPAHLAVTLPGGACIHHPIAHLYNPPRPDERIVVDRSRALAVVAGDPHGWNEVAHACLERAARSRNIEVETVPCAPHAAYHPTFHEKIAGARCPVIFIGSPLSAFDFCQAHLYSLKIPFLCVCETTIFPLARSSMGLPSLQRSIADFLDDAAPVPSPHSSAKRWQALIDSLVPA